MFKSKSKPAAAVVAPDPSPSTTTLGNGKNSSTPPPPPVSSEGVNPTLNGSLPEGGGGLELAKEAKEKKDRSSWVKTIGIRTLRMRRSTDSRSSRLSLPGFSSLDRPGKSKKKDKSKDDKEKELQIAAEPQYGNLTDSRHIPSSNSNYPVLYVDEGTGLSSITSEHVNVPKNNAETSSAALNQDSSTSTPKSKKKDVSSSSNLAGASGESSDKHDPARFLGEGLTFKGKLIGVLEVSGPRGDRICQEALSDLKMAVKAAGEHKQKVTVHVALDGLRIRDEKTGDCLYHHQVHKISFIAQDLTDTRAFGYIFGSPDTGHRFFGIKTEKSASQVVIAMRDLFQVVFDFKKKEIEKAKQQLEMQQKFLATRAAETTHPSLKPEPKFAIAETYIEGACAAGTSRPVPNRIAPEVDLLNLEVELTSLQEGLDSIHHNLSESGPFRGSTASISSDPLNPMPTKRSSVSSSQSHNVNNTTPIPSGFSGSGCGISDPFGDSFDPFSETSGPHSASFHLGGGTSDPFAQVDPFPSKYPGGDSEFFNSDPFDSPSGPFSFSFPAPPTENPNVATRKISESSIHLGSMNGSPAPQPKILPETRGHDNRGPSFKEKDGWTASFEDNFVPESGRATESDVFTDLDPLRRAGGVRRLKSAMDRPSSGFSSDLSPPSRTTLDQSAKHHLPSKKMQPYIDPEANLPNSFSTNFNPANNPSAAETEFKHQISSFNAKRGESPPNYSPPPPPRITGSPNPASQPHTSNNTQIVPHILPPAGTSSPRLSKKKSPQILKQITISESSSSPKTLPHKIPSLRMGGKQFTMDSSFKDDIPNLSPPPRPPHATHQQQHSVGVSGGTLKSGSASLTSAVPRPTSGSASEKRNKSPGVTGLGSGLPPEPPPRPQSSSVSLSHPLQQSQLVSPPPPLPPKKQSLSNTLSTPLGFRQDTSNKKPLSTSFSSRSESNDLPLPLPQRKMHGGGGVSEQSNFTSSALHNSGGRYAVPESNLPLNNNSPQSHRSLRLSSEKLSNTCKSGGGNVNLSMEQALSQVASLSLRDLAVKLELPVERLSSYTIQQLAQKLTEMDLAPGGGGGNYLRKKTAKPELSSALGDNKDFSGFDDDFSTASAPAPSRTAVAKDASAHSHSGGYDRYAVFRELALEDASGFSIENNVGSFRPSDEEEEQSSTTLGEKQFTSRESSSERTLQADDHDHDHDLDLTEPTQLKSASFATALANTMDDVTDVNFSEDEGKFTLDNDDDDFGSGFVKNEWATFESNFDDQFATTALVKAEDGNESPWDSEEDQDAPKAREPSPSPAPPVPLPTTTDHFDFKPFQKPPALLQQSQGEEQAILKQRINSDTGSEPRLKSTSSPDRIRSPGQFQRQSSGSSRHSERSSGNPPPAAGGKVSDYSDSGPPDRERTRRSHRRGSKDYERWDFDRSERDGSGRYRDRGGVGGDRERDFIRPDSRSSYTSISRSKYRNGDSDEEYSLNNSGSVRRIKSGTGGGGGSNTYRRRSKDFDRDVVELVVDDEEEDDRSYASHHSTSGYSRRHHHRRVPSSKYYPHHGRSSGRRDRGGGGGSPDRYSNHESDDESLEDEVYARKRDRENYAREREYYERHHRPRPNSGSSSTGKRHSPRPRHPDPYHSRRRGGGASGRYKDTEDHGGDSRELSEYSGEDEHPSASHGHHHHSSHRRVRAKRSSYYREREGRDRDPPPRSHYYTNSPSWDSESNPEGENVKEYDANKPTNKSASRRPNSGKDGGGGSSRNTTGGEEPSTSTTAPRENSRQHSTRESPENYGSRRRENKEASSRRYQSELALNSKSQQDSPNKLTAFDNFEDTFGASSLPPERSNCSNKSRNASLSSPPAQEDTGDLMSVENPVPPPASNENDKTSHSPFGDDFNVSPSQNGVEPGPQIDNLLIIDEPTPTEDGQKSDDKLEKEELQIVASNGNGLDTASLDTFPEESKFSFSGRRLESIKSEEEKSNDDNSHSQNSEGLVQMKKSDSFNIFKQRADVDPFADDEFFT